MRGVTAGQPEAMTATARTASVADRARPIAAGAPVVAAHFLGEVAVFVLGEEALLFAPRDGAPERVAVHGGGILAAASDGERILTGGDDGKVVITGRDRTYEIVAADPKRRWIDQVALGPPLAPQANIAWSAGKEAFVRSRKDEPRRLEVPSTVGGLAFAPKGVRLAIAHYNGVTLWFPNAAQATPERLEWKGSHVAVGFSPDGRFLVTAMQEPTLHGWRLVDGKHMRMSGYSAKVRSMSWSANGKALATSGSRELIVWPFQGKDGPMGMEPQMLAPAPQLVCAVACHPKNDATAVGYEDGTVLLVRIADGAEVLARRPGGEPISALTWNAAGTTLAFAAEAGDAGVIDLG
jgi:WD40 repeat protein